MTKLTIIWHIYKVKTITKKNLIGKLNAKEIENQWGLCVLK